MEQTNQTLQTSYAPQGVANFYANGETLSDSNAQSIHDATGNNNISVMADVDMDLEEEILNKYELGKSYQQALQAKLAPPVKITPNLPPIVLDERKLYEQKKTLEEKTKKFEELVKQDPWNTEAWSAMIIEAQTMHIDVARHIYERFLERFPTAGRYWKYYAEHEMACRNFENVDKIFSQCLLKCLNIDLWRSYTNYIQSTKGTDIDNPAFREQVVKAYEFALEKMGGDLMSTSIWQDYINFLKEWKPKTQYEEGQKITSLRKVYQRAVETPMQNVEDIWKEWDQYENNLNAQLAKPLLAEQTTKYQNARVLYRERKRYYDGILRNMLAKPPSASNREDHQVALWKRLISFEKKKADPQTAVTRVSFTYNQALLCLYHYPEMWYEYAMYHFEGGRSKDSVSVFERALEACPDSMILYFAYANVLELSKEFKAASDIYEKLLAKRNDPLIYVQFMRFARRTEGIKSARNIFRRGRNAPGCTYHLYVASALMEWQLNKEVTVARNIFEMGMTKFGSEAAFLQEYLKFLMDLNEENNIRALFERAITQIQPEKAREIWNMYLTFEFNYGDLSTIEKIETRRAAIYPEIQPRSLLSLVNLFRYMDLWPCSSLELESFGKVADMSRFEVSDGTQSKDSKELSVGDYFGLSKSHPRLSRYPKPDFLQMTPLDPEHTLSAETSSASLPESLAQLIMNLPAAGSFLGPPIDVDQLITVLTETPLPPPPDVGKKRKVEDEEEEEEEPAPSNVNAPPAHDLFRKRQAAKLLKKT